MDKTQLVEIVNQGTQQIMPVPIPESGISAVPSGNVQGNPIRAVYKPREHNRKNDMLQYCNFIPPAPRDPLVNVPYLGEGCPYDSNARNAPEGCFLVKNTDSNTVGFVCKDAGGAKNANFVRGNQFGVDYDMDVDGLSKSKKMEYTIENPIQLPLQMRNPLVKYDKSSFFPTYLQSYENHENEYPRAANYVDENNGGGIPTYTFPYKVINPRKSELDVVSLRSNKDGFVNQDETNDVVKMPNGDVLELKENFEGIQSSKFSSFTSSMGMYMIIFMVIIAIIVLMYIYCDKMELGCLWKKLMKK